MKLGALFGAIVVAGLASWMLATDGAWRIFDLVGRVGWLGLSAVTLFHLTQLLLSAAAWRTVAGPTKPRPGLGFYTVLRWIREGVNNLLPVAQVGGEFVGARLLNRRGVELGAAIAGAIGDMTVELVTQIAFTLFGLGLLVLTVGGGAVTRTAAIALVVAAAIAAAFAAAQWAGLAHLVEAGMMRLGKVVGWGGFGEGIELHAALTSIYRSWRRLAGASLYHLGSWVLGGLEVCLALHFLGHDMNLAAGMVIESLGQAFKAAGFAVPGAIGVQEGGYIIVCGLYGLPPELGVALSLVKRLREIALGLPGLAAWQWFEARKPAANASLPSPGAQP